MAPSSQGHSTPAPWKSAFLEHLGKMDSPEFVLSTLHAMPVGDGIGTQKAMARQELVPRARYCIFRGMWAELPENKHNKAEMNPRVYESEMPTCTTDVRMLKVGEILQGSSEPNQKPGSGGGGPVEAVWWIKEVGTQWRIRGNAFLIGPNINSNEASCVRQELGKRLSLVDPDKEAEWSWQRELTAHFGNNSPGIRGSFRAPPPGQSVHKPYDHRLELGEKVDDLEDGLARENFRVLAIRPDEVEQLDLSDPKTARRHLFTYDVEQNKWTSQEQWP